jgi:hypothetical protein
VESFPGLSNLSFRILYDATGLQGVVRRLADLPCGEELHQSF